jgi:hypothetical protein
MRSFLARNKLRLFVGMAFASVFLAIFNILTFAKVWSATFEYYGVPSLVVYVGIPVAYFVITFGLGYAYEFSGLWEKEVSYQNLVLNPEVRDMIDNMKVIRKILEEKK